MSRASRPAALVLGTALLALTGIGCGSDSDSGSSEAAERTSPSTPSSPSRPKDGLLSHLRNGGTVIVFRHAATDPSDEDDAQVVLEDCSTQRNLTDKGRADAETIGAAFRELQIPVGPVWASPYCRARDTAELAFGRRQVVDGLERLYPEVDEVADRRLNELIGERAPAVGDPNLVIASHQIYPSALEPPVALEEGEAAIYSVRNGEVDLLGQVDPDEWAGLDSNGPSANGADELGDVGEQAQASVVSVELSEGEPSGAAFRVAVDGILVTNAHVVGDAETVTTVLPDGTRRPATVLGRDREVDIAVLELDEPGLPPMHSGTGLADAAVADPVLAVGPSLGTPPAGSAGTIDALDQLVRLGDGELEVLATTAVIEPANSGGPLVDADGEVLGVSTAIATPLAGDRSGRGGFAIPVDVARSAALELVEAAR